MIGTRTGRTRIVGLGVAVVAGLSLGAPAAASAAAVALDAPDNGSPPLVAYSPVDHNTYVAWTAPSNGGIDLCVFPAGATACENGVQDLTDTVSGGPDLTGAAAPEIAGLVVLPNGEVVVLGSTAQGAVGTLSWASASGGAGFFASGNGLQNGGNPISPVSMFYTVNNAVALSNSDVALFDSFDHSYSFFSDSPFAGPEFPTTLAMDTCPSNTGAGPQGNANNCGQFDDQKLETLGSVIAAEPAPPPAASGTDVVVGVGANNGSLQTTPSGCVNYAATGFGVSVGKVGASSAAGSLNGNGLQPNGFQLLACSAETPVLTSPIGGTQGIGVIEQEGNGIDGAGSTYAIDFRPFTLNASTPASSTWGSPVQLEDISSLSLAGADNIDATDDAADGVYASWEDKQGLVLDYSPNGGATWDGPVVVPALSTGGAQSDPTIAGIGSGVVEVAYEANLGTGNQVFLQAIDAIPPAPATPVTVTTSQTSGTASGASISIPAGTVGETDTATLAGTNAAAATGTVTYNLYSNSSCTGTAVATSTGAVTAGKAAPSQPATASLTPGSYYWEASYGGDALNLAATSACGSEVLTVTAASTQPTTGSSNGSTITITVSCSIACTVTATITVGGGAAADRAGAARATTLGHATLVLKAAGKGTLTFKLSKKSKKTLKTLFKKDHGKVTATLSLSTKAGNGTFPSTGKLVIAKKKK